MSVTITIRGNREYCLRHHLGRRYEDEYGVHLELPFGMNLANGNFCTLFSALGLEAGEGNTGELDGRIIQERILSTPIELLVRADTQEGNWYSAGIPEERARRYLLALAQISLEAERREEPVVWG